MWRDLMRSAAFLEKAGMCTPLEKSCNIARKSAGLIVVSEPGARQRILNSFDRKRVPASYHARATTSSAGASGMAMGGGAVSLLGRRATFTVIHPVRRSATLGR